MWIDPKTKRIFKTHSEIRSGFPSVSFPEVFNANCFAAVGLEPVTQALPPEYDPLTQDLIELVPVKVNGVWTQQWQAIPVPVEEQNARIDAKRAGMEVSAFQAHAALLQAGLLSTVEALIASPEADPLVVLAWNKATTFRRTSPAIIGLASALGWSDAQLDQLFEVAATIEV